MRKTIFFIAFLFVFITSFGQKAKQFKIRTVAFYNLENLFDTINDVTKNDELSPIMEMKGNRSKVYFDKLNKLSSVIARIGKDRTKTSPAIIGVAEVENRSVLEDLISTKYLKKERYGIIHFDSPDRRGIDVALLYKERYFKPTHYENFELRLWDGNRRIYTRDQLLVSGYLDDELIHIIVNHWPSRRGGEAKSSHLREKAAYLNKKIIKKIREEDPNSKIMIIGDFNDDPINKSFKKVLKTKANAKNIKKGDIYNPYEKLFKEGYNTLGYRDNINLFDQILLSSSLISKEKKDYSSYKMFKAKIFNKGFLTQKKGRYKGYPFRSFSYGKYTGGYSDHYPVYVYLIKEKNSNR